MTMEKRKRRNKNKKFHIKREQKMYSIISTIVLRNKEKIFFIRMKKKMYSIMSTIVRFIPVALVLAAVGLTVTDQYTDGTSAHRICTANCSCEILFGVCNPIPGICSSDIINGKPASDHCKIIDSDARACLAKEPYHAYDEQSMCYCKYSYTIWSGCFTPDGNCSSVSINGRPAWEYCKVENINQRSCQVKVSWPVPQAEQLQFRHPFWCSISTGFIIGPSILNNLFVLYSLLLKSNYKRYFVNAGVSCLAEFQYAQISIILLSILQVLPYLVLVLKIVIMFRICMKYIDEDAESSDLNSITTRMNAIFSFSEDLPQLTLQMVFILRAMKGYNYGIMDAISLMSVAGLFTSCISLSKNYTLFIIDPDSLVGSKILTFFTAFMAVGGRLLTCCLYEDFNSWCIFLPISSMIAINIIVSICKFVFSHCRKFKDCNFSSPNQNIDISNPQETKYQRLFQVASKAGKGIRSLLFGVIIDGQSITGLWSSACYALLAVWNFNYFIWNLDKAIRASMIITMLSYTINAITVLLNGQHRGQGLLVAVLFMIGRFIMFVNSNEYDYNYKDLVFVDFTVTLGGLVILSFIISIVLDVKKAINTLTGGLV